MVLTVLLVVVVVADDPPLVVDPVPLPPLPTLVVIGPLSIYTPEKYQDSGAAVLTILRTPRCQSAELVLVDAGTLFTTLVKGADPVDAHNPTVPAENWSLNELERPHEYLKCAYVDVVGKVEPGSGGEGGAPLGIARHHPFQVCGVRAYTVFELIVDARCQESLCHKRGISVYLSEMTFEEANLSNKS